MWEREDANGLRLRYQPVLHFIQNYVLYTLPAESPQWTSVLTVCCILRLLLRSWHLSEGICLCLFGMRPNPLWQWKHHYKCSVKLSVFTFSQNDSTSVVFRHTLLSGLLYEKIHVWGSCVLGHLCCFYVPQPTALFNSFDSFYSLNIVQCQGQTTAWVSCGLGKDLLL